MTSRSLPCRKAVAEKGGEQNQHSRLAHPVLNTKWRRGKINKKNNTKPKAKS